ncbi:hypothetical protein MACJ_003987 [Theileria orientalis]|uniref:Uncharacterized protein n=1 Tax=Theileria orientalis TaxID=68886 RepID=A0A976XJG4_THEOR|nr:hypothetical protein MACJ_003987 [Theileria orientalis]
MYRHDLSQSKDSSKVKDIGGLRFFVTGLRRDNSSLAYKEVKFYEDVDTKENNRIVVTYTPGPGRANQLSNNDNAYVYFHDNDSRPLLLFYNDRGYKAKDKKDYDNNIWTLDTSIRSGNCEDGGNIYLSNALNNICYYLEIASCREESGTSRPTTTQPGDTHSTISSTPQQKLPPQPPVPHPPRLAPPTLSGQLTTGSSLPPPPEEKSKLPPAKTIQEDRRLTKSLGDQQPRGGHSHTRESRTESESSLPDTTIQMSNRESSSHRDVEMPVQKPESPHGGTRLEEKAQPSEVPKTPVLLPEKTHIQEPTVELPVPDLKEQLHSETNVMVEQRLSIERSPSPIRRKAPEAVSPRSAQHRTEKPQDHSDAPKAEARTDAHDSDSSSESEDQTITIAISAL